jgi:hypothetical protein
MTEYFTENITVSRAVVDRYNRPVEDTRTVRARVEEVSGISATSDAGIEFNPTRRIFAAASADIRAGDRIVLADGRTVLVQSVADEKGFSRRFKMALC